MKDRLLFDGELFAAIYDRSKKTIISACKGMRKEHYFGDIMVANIRKVLDRPSANIEEYTAACEYMDWFVTYFKLGAVEQYHLAMLRVRIAPAGYKKDILFAEAEKLCPRSHRTSFLLAKLNWASSSRNVKLTKEVLTEIEKLRG